MSWVGLGPAVVTASGLATNSQGSVPAAGFPVVRRKRCMDAH